MLQRYILLWLVLSSGLAFLWPELHLSVAGIDFSFAEYDPFQMAGGPAINALIVLTMFSVGTLLPIDEVNQVFLKWPRILGGTAIQYTCMPVLAWIVVRMMEPDPATAAGIFIVGCVPGAMASNVLTLTARGNVSYSVSLTTAATLLSPLVVPLTLELALQDTVAYDGAKAVRLLVLQIVLPVVAGHLLSRYAKSFRRLSARCSSIVANLSILAIIAIAVGLRREEVREVGPMLATALAAINIGGYLCGYFGGARLKLSEPMRRALTLEVGMQNAGAGIVLAQQLFPEQRQAVVPCILYTFGCMFTGTILATVWHWVTKDGGAEEDGKVEEASDGIASRDVANATNAANAAVAANASEQNPSTGSHNT